MSTPEPESKNLSAPGIDYESWKAGAVIPIDELLKIAAGPGLYVLLKGKGR